MVLIPKRKKTERGKSKPLNAKIMNELLEKLRKLKGKTTIQEKIKEYEAMKLEEKRLSDFFKPFEQKEWLESFETFEQKEWLESVGDFDFSELNKDF